LNTQVTVQFQRLSETPITPECRTINEGEDNEFHIFQFNVEETLPHKVQFFFNTTQEFINFLNDLRSTCENKIWDLTAMPSEYEYDYAREPF
jgi:hypothetical protein